MGDAHTAAHRVGRAHAIIRGGARAVAAAHDCGNVRSASGEAHCEVFDGGVVVFGVARADGAVHLEGCGG
jgi:hypothetical protein